MDLITGGTWVESTLHLKGTFTSDEYRRMLNRVRTVILQLNVPWTADQAADRDGWMIYLTPSDEYHLTPEKADHRGIDPVFKSILTLDQIYGQLQMLRETLEMDIRGKVFIMHDDIVEEEQDDGTTEKFVEERELVRLTF